jgi:hypothetical protein
MTSLIKKTAIGALAAATLMGTLAISTTEASAQWRRHHYRGGWNPGAVAAVGVGALALGAIAAQPRYYDPYYGAPGYGAPAPVYYDDGYYAPPRRCWRQRQEVVDNLGYLRTRMVRVCR